MPTDKKVCIYDLGRIADIIVGLKKSFSVDSILTVPTKEKLNALCRSIQLTPAQFDSLIADNSPIFRTIKGHAFEVFFDLLFTKNGIKIEEVGGDTGVDRIVNGITLQLKTPTLAGTSEEIVQYKTHKTHGAKSEVESFDYYHSKGEFADYLVGLISYDPFRVIILSRDELPTHPRDASKILSPFSIRWKGHAALNAFDRLGIRKIDLPKEYIKIDPSKELLPKTAMKIGLTSDIVLDTILNIKNFRIWDMGMRGFAREVAFRGFLSDRSIAQYKPSETGRERCDKSDLALAKSQPPHDFVCFQIKGASLNICTWADDDSVVAIETQLTRGRINDHPTQSRMYLQTDFDQLILCIDPFVGLILSPDKRKRNELSWEFYAIPTEDLLCHGKYATRIKPIQLLKYRSLKKYLIDDNWVSKWRRS